MSDNIQRTRLPNMDGLYGKLDAASEEMLLRFNGDAALLIVVNLRDPDAGGFSVSAADPVTIKRLPEFLRNVADSIDDQLRATRSS